MGIQEQAKYAGTTLSRFLDECLPHRAPVIEAWTEVLASAVPSGIPALRHGRDSAGWALELRIGLDLASTPPRLQELSYLSIDRCTALLAAAGFEHAPVGALPANGTADPLLRHWKRARRPTDSDDQSAAFLDCLALDSFRQPMHRWGTKRTVDERRSLFASMATEADDTDGNTELLDALKHCWTLYLERGRQALLVLGEPVVVAPELAGGYGVADLVIGRTLVDVKLAVEPTDEDVAVWLRQLLGYVLLDRFDTFRLDAVAVYCGWRGKLLTWPLPALLSSATPGPAPSLDSLRAGFYEVLHDELDSHAAWKERERYF